MHMKCQAATIASRDAYASPISKLRDRHRYHVRRIISVYYQLKPYAFRRACGDDISCHRYAAAMSAKR